MSQALDSLIIGKKEDVSDQLLLLNPMQIPILSLVGFSSPVVATTHEWIEDKMNARVDLINGAKLVGDTTITVDTGSLFRPKQVIKIGEELLYITAVSGNNLTVVRGYGGTTAAAIADNARIDIMFNLQAEGSDAREAIYIPRVDRSNYTQIFEDTVKVSGTAQAIAQHGIAQFYEYEKMKRQDALAFELENALVNGIKFKSGDIRMMGGIRQFISTNVTDAAGVDLTWDMINNEMYKIFQNGGMKSASNHVLMVPAIQNTKITKLDKDLVRTTNDAGGTGRNITSVTTNYGTLNIVPNINLKPDEIFITDINRIKVMPLQGRTFSHKYLGERGDFIEGQIVGEYTMEFVQEEAHSRIRNLKTT